MTFNLVGLAALIMAPAIRTLQFLRPRVLFEAPPVFKVGTPDRYLPDSVTFLERHRVFIVRRPDGFRALSAVCTHLGCTVEKKEGSVLRCPCHGSEFDEHGNVTGGPAPAPLNWLLIELAGDGRLLVDSRETVPEDRALAVQG